MDEYRWNDPDPTEEKLFTICAWIGAAVGIISGPVLFLRIGIGGIAGVFEGACVGVIVGLIFGMVLCGVLMIIRNIFQDVFD